MKKTIYSTFALLGVLLLLSQCKPHEEAKTTKILEPQPFPTTYGFPVAEATLIAYTQDYTDMKDLEGIYTHAWQIWAGPVGFCRLPFVLGADGGPRLAHVCRHG